MPFIPDVQSHLRMPFDIVHMMHCRSCSILVLLSAPLTFVVIHVQHLLPDLLPSAPHIEPVYIIRHAPPRELYLLLCHCVLLTKKRACCLQALLEGNYRAVYLYTTLSIYHLYCPASTAVTDSLLSGSCYCFSAAADTSVLFSGNSPCAFCMLPPPQRSFSRTSVCIWPACS